jgi:nicotinamide riboside kinase
MEKGLSGVLKIAIVGPESTGKSTLAEALAAHYQEPFVPEIARTYVQDLNRPYQLHDIEEMAKLQLYAEQDRLPEARNFLFCDTSLLVHKIWSQFVFQQVPLSINKAYKPNEYALHLLCNIDLPWVEDPLREHPHQRHELFGLYEYELQKSAADFVLISGKHEQRLKHAVEAIDHIYNTKRKYILGQRFNE